MRPAEFTPESIIRAGQELQAAGRNITGFALRQKVGGGNPSRLKQVWDEHLAGQSASQAEPVADLPVEVAEEVATVTGALTERIATLAIELNDKAVKAAERRVAEVVRTAGEQTAQAERELADAAQTVDDLETQLDGATAKAGDLEHRLADAQATNQAQAIDLAQLRERLAASEQTAKMAGEQHAGELERMSSALEQLRGELAEQKQTAKDAARIANETHAQEVRRVAESLTRAEADRETARREAASAREEAAKLRGQVEILQTQAGELLQAFGTRQEHTPDVPAQPASAERKPRATKKGAATPA